MRSWVAEGRCVLRLRPKQRQEIRNANEALGFFALCDGEGLAQILSVEQMLQAMVQRRGEPEIDVLRQLDLYPHRFLREE